MGLFRKETTLGIQDDTRCQSVEPIAIVGMASRLPGAESLAAFWDVLLNGRDTVSDDIPVHLRGVDWSDVRTALGDPEAKRLGGFLNGIDEFDAGFFGVSRREAIRMSPVQRILLEIVWEALEDAGIPAESIAGTRTAVFTSCLLNSEYWDLLVDRGIHDIHALLGTVMHGAASGRIAYTFDLRGPNMAVDATCAGSLTAVHLACRSLQCGESEAAIVGSVNLQLDSLHTTALARGRVISATGACRFGDRSADGYVRSDGALAVVLKPLPRAIADGDRIYATILGSGTSSNGRGASLIAPRAAEQATAIRVAQAEAGVLPEEIDYVEAHGTGTVQGDRTELAALCELMQDSRGPDDPCFVGSAKSNVGHTEAASGLVGLVKTALALWHRTIPRTLHVRAPNEMFAKPGLPLRLVDTPQPWAARHSRRLAGVSSFGMSGTNVHLVLGEAPRVPPRRHHRASPGPLVLPVSARAPEALRELALAYHHRIASADDAADVCYSAGARRSHHQHRIAVVGADRADVAAALRRFADGQPAPGVVIGEHPVHDRPRIAFVFPGQGTRWAGVGQELLAANAVFRQRMIDCDQAVQDECGWSLIDRLTGGKPLPDKNLQTMLWAVQVSLAAMWRDWGLVPDTVIGHSMGEIAAATVTGALSVRDAAAVVCRRGALSAELAGSGAMVAVHLGETQVREAIGELAGQVSVAAVNSDHSTVLSGGPNALTAVVTPLRARGVRCRPLPVTFPSHSPRVEPLRDRMLTALADVRPRRADLPMRSTVLARDVDGSELDARYWMANLRQPVRFAHTVATLLADRRRTVFVEISPRPTLVSALADIIASAGHTGCVIPSLCPESGEVESMAGGLARAYVNGCTPDWSRVTRGSYVPLPTYPWQRAHYWAEQGATAPAPRTLAASLPASAPPVVTLATHLVPPFVTLLATLLGVPPANVDTAVPLVMLGVDSLLALTLRDRVRQDLGVELTVADLFGAHSVADLAAEVSRRQSGAL